MNLSDKRYSLGFYGAGNMAEAIISGLAENGEYTLNAYDINARRLAELSKYNVLPAASPKELLSRSDIIFLCIKPQSFEDAAEEMLNAGVLLSNKLFVSIMAGISANSIRQRLSADRVIQAMPNTPLMMKMGATALCRTPYVKDGEYALVRSIFSELGIVADLLPEQMNAVVSVNGSSPAYIYLFVNAVMEGAYIQGIDPETAKILICQTLKGAAQMVMESGETPEKLIEKVSSPGGTTVAALEVLNRKGFSDIIIEAMKACTRRAKELSS